MTVTILIIVNYSLYSHTTGDRSYTII